MGAGIKFCEFMSLSIGDRPREEYARLHKARHAALMEVVSEFYIVTTVNAEHLTDLTKRIAESDVVCFLFNNQFTLMEQRYIGEHWVAPKMLSEWLYEMEPRNV